MKRTLQKQCEDVKWLEMSYETLLRRRGI